MANIQAQSWRVYRGEDADITLTGTDSTNPTGWAFVVTLSPSPGYSPVTLSTTSVTVGGSGPYTLTVSLTRAQTSTLTRGEYAIDFWRTDSGNAERLAGGRLFVDTPVRLPA